MRLINQGCMSLHASKGGGCGAWGQEVDVHADVPLGWVVHYQARCNEEVPRLNQYSLRTQTPDMPVPLTERFQIHVYLTPCFVHKESAIID